MSVLCIQLLPVPVPFRSIPERSEFSSIPFVKVWWVDAGDDRSLLLPSNHWSPAFLITDGVGYTMNYISLVVSDIWAKLEINHVTLFHIDLSGRSLWAVLDLAFSAMVGISESGRVWPHCSSNFGTHWALLLALVFLFLFLFLFSLSLS